MNEYMHHTLCRMQIGSSLNPPYIAVVLFLAAEDLQYGRRSDFFVLFSSVLLLPLNLSNSFLFTLFPPDLSSFTLSFQSQASNKRKLDEYTPTLSGSEAKSKAQKYLSIMGSQKITEILLNM